MDQLDRETRIGPNLANKLRDAGFRDVQSQIFNVPIGTWPTGELDILVPYDTDALPEWNISAEDAASLQRILIKLQYSKKYTKYSRMCDSSRSSRCPLVSTINGVESLGEIVFTGLDP
jgi:hypothetical protein